MEQVFGESGLMPLVRLPRAGGYRPVPRRTRGDYCLPQKANIPIAAPDIKTIVRSAQTLARREFVHLPMMLGLFAITVITIRIGTAATPLRTADQKSALIG